MLVAQAQRTGHQGARIDLAIAVKDDAVAVDDVHRTVGLDLPRDLAGLAAGIVDAVQGDPIVAAVRLAAALLVEIDDGIFADIEGFPVQDGFVVRLPDLDDGLAAACRLRRSVCIEPACRETVAVDLQATFGQSIGPGAGAGGGETRRCLQRLLRGDIACCQGKIGECALLLLLHALLLRRGAVQGRDRHAIRQFSAGLRDAAYRPFLRHPGRTEGLLRIRVAHGAARRQHQGDGSRQWLDAPRQFLGAISTLRQGWEHRCKTNGRHGGSFSEGSCWKDDCGRKFSTALASRRMPIRKAVHQF